VSISSSTAFGGAIATPNCACFIVMPGGSLRAACYGVYDIADTAGGEPRYHASNEYPARDRQPDLRKALHIAHDLG